MDRFKRGMLFLTTALLVWATASAQHKRSIHVQLNRALIQALDHLTVGDRRHARIMMLLKRGADPNTKINEYGRTLLMSASGWGVEDDIHCLVKFGANINARDTDGDTALIYAVMKGREENIRLLLRLHADANLHDKNGDTALSLAEANFADNATTPFLHIEKEARRKYWAQIVRMLRQVRSKQLPSGSKYP